ncbi:MAG: prepilin-type N-terminal cleavage/methylation domain-containing protein [bacterium]|nr:prepilin-type N-terminal cleavage/methylation domain-containing protein [bacterium]MDZ4296269.1 prepilin-type N-terminal cleavage/methylation domain-containing protein [Patescibacteria group bacterium]MDZ4296284.1 prepilin-type N-terminal cleavage/methylation domain-containing protein [Patescibacteria group bacterium]
MKRANKGFTLIELLVVIAIIGILATIVLVSLGTARQRARDARRIADVRQIALALQLYHEDNGEYVDALSELAPTYMKTVPTDPVGGVDYLYGTDAIPATDYVLGADLESNNVVLGDDEDGADVHGVDCQDANYVYCVQPQ